MPTEQTTPRARRKTTAFAPFELYRTDLGRALVGTAEALLADLPANSVDLVMTSPPFPLLRAKEYGNLDESAYTDWLVSLGPAVRRVLRDTGSFVLDLGGAYRKKRPARSLYNYRVLLRLCDECGFHLAEEFFWHNPCKLPSPIEWVNKRKIRAKDSVNTVWWLSRTEWPRADVRNVLTEYSPRMRQLLADPERFCSPIRRPSGHAISRRFAGDNGGAIPSNLLTFSNTDSNSLYLRLCKRFGLRPHPARFPEALPDFFLRFLTNPGDTVVDLFAGSNATGAVAQRLGRRWLSVDSSLPYVLASALRFMEGWSDEAVGEYLEAAREEDIPLVLSGDSARILHTTPAAKSPHLVQGEPLMVDPSAIREHMEVVAASGIHVGTVDRVEGTTIKLTRDDPDAGGQHHYIPLDWVDTVGLTVRLTRTWDEVKDHWLSSPAQASS